jgi:hypothetical protein
MAQLVRRVLNGQDSLYKGYKKRLVSLPTASEASATAVVDASSLEDELSYGKNDKVDKVRNQALPTH